MARHFVSLGGFDGLDLENLDTASPSYVEPYTVTETPDATAARDRVVADRDELYASELKGILLRLRPDFNEKSYGCATFGKLLDKLSRQFGALHIRSDNFNVMVSVAANGKEGEAAAQMTRENWKTLVGEQLSRYKEDGFERINPSILKADIQASYPDFSEKALGFKRFSDLLKAMEKDGLITVELDEQKNMLIKVS